jgi:hypothetical protein
MSVGWARSVLVSVGWLGSGVGRLGSLLAGVARLGSLLVPRLRLALTAGRLRLAQRGGQACPAAQLGRIAMNETGLPAWAFVRRS